MGEPVQIPILGVGRFAGVEPGIFCGIFYRLGCCYQRLGLKGNILGNILRRGLRLGLARRNGSNMARVDCSRRLPLERVAARGPTVQDLQAARVDHLGVRST